jgi:hypothetical protein
MIWRFTELRTNKKNENMTFLMKILQGLVLKHVYILASMFRGKFKINKI